MISQGSTTTTTINHSPIVYRVDSDDPHAGGPFFITGNNWLPGSNLDFELHSTPVHLGSVTVGSDGSFDFKATIPADTTPGTHEIVATGTGADQQPATSSFSVNVLAAEGSPQTTSTTTTTVAHSGSLPFSGGSTLPLLVAGVALLGAGAGMAARKRRSDQV